MNAFRTWLNNASAREQLTLGLGGMVLIIWLLLVVILDPLNQSLQDQQDRNQAGRESLERVRDMAARWVHRPQESGQAAGQSIVELVDRSLRRHNIRMSGMQPSGTSDVRLRIDQVGFDNLLAWLYEMEVVENVQIRDLSVAAASDPGTVVVNVRLHKE